MHKIEAPGATQDNTFTEGNPSTGTEATTVSAAWLNAVQGEIVKVIEAAGLTLKTEEAETGDQLLAALGVLAPAQNIAVFDTVGVTEWTVPDVLKSGQRKAHVTVVGGGAGGAFRSGNASGGGQAGGYAYGLVDLVGVSSVDITVGEGGLAGTNDGGSASPGGSSSFGSFATAVGGSPPSGASAIGGYGAVQPSINGFITSSGGPGFRAGRWETNAGNTSTAGGNGGSSVFGGGGSGLSGSGGGEQNAAAYGAGGAGGINIAGNGKSGIVIVRW